MTSAGGPARRRRRCPGGALGRGGSGTRGRRPGGRWSRRLMGLCCVCDGGGKCGEKAERVGFAAVPLSSPFPASPPSRPCVSDAGLHVSCSVLLPPPSVCCLVPPHTRTNRDEHQRGARRGRPRPGSAAVAVATAARGRTVAVRMVGSWKGKGRRRGEKPVGFWKGSATFCTPAFSSFSLPSKFSIALFCSRSHCAGVETETTRWFVFCERVASGSWFCTNILSLFFGGTALSLS